MRVTSSYPEDYDDLTSSLPLVCAGQLRSNHGCLVMVLAPAHRSFTSSDENPAGWTVVFVHDSLDVEKRSSRWGVGERRYLSDYTLRRYFELVSAQP